MFVTLDNYKIAKVITQSQIIQTICKDLIAPSNPTQMSFSLMLLERRVSESFDKRQESDSRGAKEGQ